MVTFVLSAVAAALVLSTTVSSPAHPAETVPLPEAVDRLPLGDGVA
jgi:hypothetical protein